MTVHVLFDIVDGNLKGVYSDINILYEAVRNYLRTYEDEKYVCEFNELLLTKGTDEALRYAEFYVCTIQLDQ